MSDQPPPSSGDGSDGSHSNAEPEKRREGKELATDEPESDSSSDSDRDQAKDVPPINTALSSMDELEKSLPMKRGLSSSYDGKSKSFSDLTSMDITDTSELGKEENPLNKRQRLIASHDFIATPIFNSMPDHTSFNSTPLPFVFDFEPEIEVPAPNLAFDAVDSEGNFVVDSDSNDQSVGNAEQRGEDNVEVNKADDQIGGNDEHHGEDINVEENINADEQIGGNDEQHGEDINVEENINADEQIGGNDEHHGEDINVDDQIEGNDEQYGEDINVDEDNADDQIGGNDEHHD